jgi:hypothetical protein
MIRKRACAQIRLATLLAALAATGQAAAESYTNNAGEEIAGTVAGFTNGLVSMRTEHGMIQTVSLKAFPAAEQERLLLAAGEPLPLPADLDQRLEFLRDSGIRAERLQLAGQQPAEAALARQQALRAAWRRGLDEALAQGRISSALHGQWINALPE